jgi:hypothetical protein
MFPPTAELAPDVDFGELGRRFEISGGNIRNAAIRAAFLAVSEGHAIDMDTLIRAAVREAREMGVLIADPALIARAERDRNAALMAPPPPEAAAGGDGEPEQSPPPSSPKPSPRLVPITRPR